MSETAFSSSSQKRRAPLTSRWGDIASFAISALFVGGLLFVMISLQDGVEAGVAGLAGWLPVGYAFSAGMVASVNPCGSDVAELDLLSPGHPGGGLL